MRIGIMVFCCLFIVPTFVGCGSGSKNDFAQEIDVDFSAVIKSDLESISKSGRLGSGMGVLLSNVTALKSKDPEKADAIKNGIDEMIKLQGEAKIKAKALEILKLL